MLKIGDKVKIKTGNKITKENFWIADIIMPGKTARGSRRLYKVRDKSGNLIYAGFKESDLITMNGVKQAILRISEMKIKRETELQLPKKKKRSKTRKKRYNKKKEQCRE